MATKKKQDWIKGICKLDDENEGLLGEIPRDELEKYTVGQLKALMKDMEADIEAEKTPEPKDTESTQLETTDSKEVKGKFASICGSEFNPKKTGECHKQCQADFPEAFTACVDNYKTLESTTTTRTKSKPSVGKTTWGHTNGKQAGLIDDFFFGGKIGSLKEVAEFSGGKEGRCMHHMRHLVFDLDICIKFKSEKVTETIEEKEVAKQVKKYWWADKDKRRKGDDLVGKSAYK